MEIKDRLLIIMDQFQLSASQFADNLEIQRSSISHLLSGRNKPSINILEKIISNFPTISIEWLITGIGNPLKNNEIKPNDSNSIQSVLPNLPFDNNDEPNETIDEKNKTIDQTSYAKKDKKIQKIILIFDDNSFEVLHQ